MVENEVFSFRKGSTGDAISDRVSNPGSDLDPWIPLKPVVADVAIAELEAEVLLYGIGRLCLELLKMDPTKDFTERSDTVDSAIEITERFDRIDSGFLFPETPVVIAAPAIEVNDDEVETVALEPTFVGFEPLVLS
ncbi:hypothetical protein BGZ80_001442 [Entomortierella chlamydospora]|uniref:Uncharacterized protein n=1 Tax=Entomortierella chlamydospora TaxID=101097 RepID=A0A9P6MR27_9FUNG|nr:hypothetical protein BGZ79_011083 [Entomortierella chlamydospora]KAG0010490.1 hypothetical protein BGZ80_001442 [Entomortierella chlamydospora]